MDVVAYYSVLFNSWAYEQHENWRMKTFDGRGTRDLRTGWILSGRYGLCCPNNLEYRAFEKGQITELLDGYELDGIFFDMNWWPVVCYCEACQSRFAGEVGGDIPRVIDWTDKRWRLFQQKRVQWITEHALYVHDVAKELRPQLSVQHNFNILLLGWSPAFTESISDAVDFTSGDFYGGYAEKDFVCKTLRSLSPNHPFEFMTSRAYPILSDHTSTKPSDMLEFENYLALSHGGAFFFIDAIDPLGTMNSAVYETMGKVFEKSRPYERSLGGSLVSDVAVYCSCNSFIDPADDGSPPEPVDVFDERARPRHLSSAVAAARALRERHILFNVLTKRSLGELDQYKAVVLSDLVDVDAEERGAFRRYVEAGGGLYVSSRGALDLVTDLLPLELKGSTAESVTYITPTAAADSLGLGAVSSREPLSLFEPQVMASVNAQSHVETLATLTLPYTDPADPTRLASIHSNPPGRTTSSPAVVRAQVGAGQVVWASAPFEAVAAEYIAHGDLFAALVRQLVGGSPRVQTTAPACVEVLVFDDPANGHLTVNLLNFQEGPSILPVFNFEVSIRLEGRRPKSAVLLPTEIAVGYRVEADSITISVDRLEIFSSIQIHY